MIEQYKDDGTNKRVFANGVRNAVGMSLHPFTNQLWANNNGSDRQGNEVPPEWIDIIRDGGFYGHPFAYGSKVWFDFDAHADYVALKPITNADSQKVATMIEPAGQFRAHTAPLSLEFMNNSFFNSYRNGFLMALHGSWNTTNPNDFRGYSVLYGDLTNEQDTTVNYVADFCTGFLTDTVNRTFWARPVGLAAGNDGSVYMSSDNATTFIMQFYPDGSNSINEHKRPALNSVKVYPNPSSGSFSLAFETSENVQINIDLYDMTGRRVTRLLENEQINPGLFNRKFEWGELPAGWYLVKVTTETGVVTHKVQKL